MFGLLGRIKMWAIVVLTAALPILYIIGQLIGKKNARTASENDRLRDINQTNEEIANFYRKIAEYEEDNTNGSLHNRDNLIERLRDNGL